ncbi:MAG: hypothetical protein KAF91_30475 [Nostoc sp. TH1S01]|nr:hypothetical protein [Nostoc sp. TH1S01]
MADLSPLNHNEPPNQASASDPQEITNSNFTLNWYKEQIDPNNIEPIRKNKTFTATTNGELLLTVNDI